MSGPRSGKITVARMLTVVPQAINPAPPRPVVSGGLNTASPAFSAWAVRGCADAVGLEPTPNGFGDRCTTSYATRLGPTPSGRPQAPTNAGVLLVTLIDMSPSSVDLQRIERCSGVSRHAGLHTVETNLGPSASTSIDAEAIAPLESRWRDSNTHCIGFEPIASCQLGYTGLARTS